MEERRTLSIGASILDTSGVYSTTFRSLLILPRYNGKGRNDEGSQSIAYCAADWRAIPGGIGLRRPVASSHSIASKVVEMCPVSVLTPFSLKKRCAGTPEDPILSGCEGIYAGFSCGKWIDGFAPLSLEYFRYNLENNQFFRHVDIGLHRKPLDQFVLARAGGILAGQDQDGKLVVDAAVIPVLTDLVGDCGQEKTRKTEAAPIASEN